jgi:hypothetical protein
MNKSVNRQLVFLWQRVTFLITTFRSLLSEAHQVPTPRVLLVPLGHLRGAQAFDLVRGRGALAQYEIVMKLPNVHRSRERAAQGLRK